MMQVNQISDNEIYLLIKYIKSVLWRVAKRLSLYTGRTVLKFKPRERAFKQFKSPVLNVLSNRDREMRLQFCRQFVGILTENPDLTEQTSDQR